MGPAFLSDMFLDPKGKDDWEKIDLQSSPKDAKNEKKANEKAVAKIETSETSVLVKGMLNVLNDLKQLVSNWCHLWLQ